MSTKRTNIRYQLDSRKDRILHAVVNDYIATAEPIGSEWLVAHYDFGVKPATIRSEMAAMADLGYLKQPHVSAGRIPSDLGYRYFVDYLIDGTKDFDLSLHYLLEKLADRATLEDILIHTCRILSELTSYPTIASQPELDQTTIRHIYLTTAGSHHIVIFLLLSSGQVTHCGLNVAELPPPARLLEIANWLSQALCDMPFNQIANINNLEPPFRLAVFAPLISQLKDEIQSVLNRQVENRVLLEGTNLMLRQPEFQDIRRLDAVLGLLEQGAVILQLLKRFIAGDSVSVLIGSEAAVDVVKDCSVVGAQYTIDHRPAGYLAVIGPTRMEYKKTISAVDFIAHHLSDLLTEVYLQ